MAEQAYPTGDDGMNPAEAVILNVLQGVKGAVPVTKLAKLVYLADYVHFQHYGSTITGFQYQWDRYGPNAVGHAIVSEAEELALKGWVLYWERENSYGGTTKNFQLTAGDDIPSLSPEVRMVVDDVLHRYGSLSVQAITAESKETASFRQASQYDLLEMEQRFPALSTTEEDWWAHQAELEEYGTLSLEEIKEMYGLE